MVSLGGTFLGLLWGLATAFITKYTDHVRGESFFFLLLETLRSRFGHLTANGKPRFAVSG